MAVQHIFQLRTFSLLNLFEKHRQLYIFFHHGDVISLDVLLSVPANTFLLLLYLYYAVQ